MQLENHAFGHVSPLNPQRHMANKQPPLILFRNSAWQCMAVWSRCNGMIFHLDKQDLNGITTTASCLSLRPSIQKTRGEGQL